MLKPGSSLMVVASVVTAAVWAAAPPFIGTWKLNPSKSTLTDQMKVASAGGGKYAFDFGGAVETIAADGRDQPGYGGTTLAVTIEGPAAWKVVRKKDGRVLLTANWTLSKDGQSLSDDFTSFAPDGTGSNVKYLYQRTTPAKGFLGTWESTSEKVNFTFLLKVLPSGADGLAIVSPYSDKAKDLSFDGKDYPNLSSNAASGSSYSARRLGERSLEITDKLQGEVVDTQQYVLSPDLGTLTLTVHKTGTRTPNILVFERQ